MKGTYKITDVLKGTFKDDMNNERPYPEGKFCAKVSFNGRDSEYVEIGLPGHPGDDPVEEVVEIEEPLLDEKTGVQKRGKEGELLTVKRKEKQIKMVRRDMPEMGANFVKEMLQKMADESAAAAEETAAKTKSIDEIEVNKSGHVR